MGYVLSGRMKVAMDDGEENGFGAGDYTVVPPGHDPWTVGTRRASSSTGRGWPTMSGARRSGRGPNGDGYGERRERHPLPGDRKWRFSL